MNPNLSRLQPYPFQRLAALCRGVEPSAQYAAIKLSIGEPKHPTPQFIMDSVRDNLQGLAHYPTTQGSDALRQSIAAWIKRRHDVALDPKTQILPVIGSREALFSFAQAVVDSSRPDPIVVCPNPFYQIYEGAAFLAGASPRFLNTVAANDFSVVLNELDDEVWSKTQLLYLCSPGNPTGKVMALEQWRAVFELADRHDFIIASDECYSEIYFDEDHPPLGALTAAQMLGRADYQNLVVFNSLSKRSNVPGMRSGFVAGDSAVINAFLQYRTYHGSAMNPAIQAASMAAWNDEAHVLENRIQYREKFTAVTAILRDCLEFSMPDAGFYLWAKTPISDSEFTRGLYRDYNVLVLPGSFLAREASGINPGENFIRIALVASMEECLEAANRIREFCAHMNNQLKETSC